MAKLPGIPRISSLIPKEISSILAPMKEILQAFTSPDNPAVRMSHLTSAGLIASFSGDKATASIPIDTAPPPSPTGLSATGAIGNIILNWDAAVSDNIAYTEVWRATTDDIATAVKIGTAPGQVYVDAIGSGATRYYWIRYISKADRTGPFNAQQGVHAATGYDASYLIDVLKANPPVGANYNQLLYTQEAPTVIDGVTIPAGVYMTTAYIRALSVTNAMIATAAIDNAKIANLDAGKITSGYIDAARVNAGSLDAKIANIDAAKITSGYLLMARIQDGAITNAKIMDAAIDNAKIANAAVNNAKIANAAVSLAKIDTATITSLSALTATIGTLRTATSGGRLEISDNVIKVFDSAGTLRVKIGNLAL